EIKIAFLSLSICVYLRLIFCFNWSSRNETAKSTRIHHRRWTRHRPRDSAGVCARRREHRGRDAFAVAREKFGRGPDIVVNNAGIARTSLFVNTDEEFWVDHLDTNLGGTFRCTHAALPEMIERGWGRIINIASIAGKTGAPYVSAYAASKHGVLGL